ncbi:hypothetical protein NECID01_0856 [Nematocida sp. AWRm77]|nr:hypothetical protein NECID01_0856 [Nematocida sp. AWRm77]
MTASTDKRTVSIVTHNNQFHADDVIACFMLSTIYPSSEIIRTRDAEVIAKGDYVVDVGDVYDPERHRYDHHQRGFAHTYNSLSDVKLSSAGLVYKHHGEEFLEALGIELGEHKETIMSLIYTNYFMGVDANDNGIDVADSPRYNERSLDAIVRDLNPSFFPNTRQFSDMEVQRLEYFKEAMNIIGGDLIRFCRSIAKDVQTASPILYAAFQSSGNKKYIVLEQSCMFANLMWSFNQKYNREVYMAIYPKLTNHGKVYYFMCIAKKGMRYRVEMPLCERWRGRREDTLTTEPGMEGALFVHASGFCGASKTYETAIYMAEETIKEYEAKNLSVPQSN